MVPVLRYKTSIKSLWARWMVRLGHYLLGHNQQESNEEVPNVLPPLTRHPGVACPRCGSLIIVNLKDLLDGDSFVCSNPLCGLRLEMDIEKSRETLEVLSKHIQSLNLVEMSTRDRIKYPNVDLKWTGMTKQKGEK